MFGWQHVSSAGFPTPTSLASAARTFFFSFSLTWRPGSRKVRLPFNGGVAQLVRALPCHGRGYGFEPRRSRHLHPVPYQRFMYILMIASECAPVAKVGGLGDVVFGLSKELEIRGHAVEIILPKYDCLRYDQIFDLQPAFKDLWVPWYHYGVHCSVYFGFVHGRKCFFIEPHSDQNFFNRRIFYGHADDDQRFA